ncbi:MAG: hypothetical protein INF75_13605 [Roseomonas sp.]|nr:hypothetical protein [Roseomonas sp.]MCA3329843.1 hypothetical protein [Roseomonas sp.]MCA3353643.1 hypothetical protein [Roseomonas sp.]MCA3372546.1 hypothetical protein [Roseomonas sp.]MCA3396546.1 hypothetical protein [Roseomonas sp.]
MPLQRGAWTQLEATGLLMMMAVALYDAGRDCEAEANAAKYLAAEAGFATAEAAVLQLRGMG